MDSQNPKVFLNNVVEFGAATDEEAIMAHRHDFGVVLNELQLLGQGVEVGVCEGDYSFQILSHWKGRKLYSIDPWRAFGEEYQDVNNVSQELHERRYQAVKSRLASFKERSEIIRKTSLEGALLFENETLDFVYLDAQHSYEAVKADIQAWYPKLKKGGILSGHDYFDAVLDCGVFGVRQAVKEFAESQKLKIYISGETHESEIESWFVVKR